VAQGNRSSDPTQRFRELITEWERGFDALANKFMGSDEFSRAMNQFQSLQLGAQKAFAETMAKQLAALNLPSREDVLRVGEAVNELDRRVARIEARLEEVAGAIGAARPTERPGPRRTRRPPGEAAADPGEAR
jgi:BMFP domain-containing protein YqiC